MLVGKADAQGGAMASGVFPRKGGESLAAGTLSIGDRSTPCAHYHTIKDAQPPG